MQQLRPRLLILDPLIRLHRLEENAAPQIAALLSYLRELQREFHLAVLLVHHARKDSHSSRRAKLCAVPVNCTAGATPIFTCTAKAPN